MVKNPHWAFPSFTVPSRRSPTNSFLVVYFLTQTSYQGLTSPRIIQALRSSPLSQAEPFGAHSGAQQSTHKETH